jgi:hypothetical protein
MELEVGMGGMVTGESGTGVGGDKQILRLRDEKRTKENPPICLRKERGIAEGNCRIEKRRNPHANVARDDVQALAEEVDAETAGRDGGGGTYGGGGGAGVAGGEALGGEFAV